MRSLSSLTILASLAALAMAAPASGAPAGLLDPGFNATGVRTDQLDLGAPPPFSYYDAIVTGADGRIQAVAGTQDAANLSKVTVRGLTLAGATDAAWAGGLTRSAVFTATAPDVAYHQVTEAVRAPDGKLVVAGIGGVEHIPTMLDRGFVQRYGGDGALDPTFGTGGSVQFVVPAAASAREAGFGDVAVDAAGRVIAVGRDSTAGSGTAEGLIVRFLPNGQLDTSFGGTGWVVQPAVDTWNEIVLSADGTAWLRGSDAAGSVVARVGADGALIPSFGTNGLVHVPQISTSTTGYKKTVASALAVLPNGRVLLAGSASWRQGAGTDFDIFESWMMRFTAAGALDPSFDGDGLARWRFGEDGAGTWADSGLRDVAVQENGDVVAVGNAGSSDGENIYHLDGLAIRVRPGGALDPRFGTAGQARLKLAPAGANTLMSRVTLGPARRILLAGGIADSATSTAAGAVRLIGDGNPTATLSAPAQVNAGTKAVLDASASADDWTIGAYSWDLNADGTFGDASGPVVSPLLGIGPHIVRVRVTDDAGQTSDASATVKVVVPFTVKFPKTLKLLGSTLKVPVSCTGPEPCAGTLSLLLKAKTARIVTINVGRTSFALRAGQRKLVRVKLAKRVRTAVRRRGRVTLTVAVRTKGVAETLQRSQLVVRR